MYPKYFGLTEAPFSITPDPHFLYLSNQHREALAHLLYGVGTNGGFVQLTGEVGTGKTTVCRAFLEQLPEQAKVALILNPSLDVSELLTVICEEFQIPPPEQRPSNKGLVDRLNRFLLDAHAQGLRPVLIIDEAQNLSIDALEQIRLLTNLETAKEKLLQIFLIGQPELKQLLEQQALRQVAQRITARYHLRPFSRKETEEYIGHRLAIAGSDVNLFSKGAVRRIHHTAQGIPRLINILCDRALLGAYATHKRQVNSAIAARAAYELMTPPAPRRERMPRPSPAALTATVVILLALAALGFWREQLAAFLPTVTAPEALAPTPPQSYAKPTPGKTAASAGVNSQPPNPHSRNTMPATDIYRLGSDRTTAMSRLFRRWKIELPDAALETPCQFALSQGLRCLGGEGALQTLRMHDRPFVLEVQDENSPRVRFLTILGLDASQLLLDLGDTQRPLPLEVLDRTSFGRFTLIWRPPAGGSRMVTEQAPPESIIWLRDRLNQLSNATLPDPDSPIFDQALRSRLIEFQNSRGLVADGIAGPNTLIQINTASAVPGTPTLAMTPR